MTAKYLQTLLSPTARAFQEADGSRHIYAEMESRSDGQADRLTDREISFITARNSFYMSSVSEDGWPYIQHRGGATGFLRALNDHQLGFADLRGNRQFMSAANITVNQKVSLFLMDYPARRRLKLAGLGRYVSRQTDPDLVASLTPDGYARLAQAAFIIDVVAFDWNCSQHITPRWTAEDLSKMEGKLL